MSDSDALQADPPAAALIRRRKPVKEFVVRRILPPIARAVYSGMGRSWHYTTENEPVLTNLLAGDKPIVGAFLHARTFQLLYYFSRPHRGRWMLMCSRSSDGDLMTSVEKGLGYRVARGSSGSGGARALAEMIKAQREDRHLNSCLAVDGSRGPRGGRSARHPDSGTQERRGFAARRGIGVEVLGTRLLGSDGNSEAGCPYKHSDRRADGIAGPDG